jgi:hypothetical protein
METATDLYMKGLEVEGAAERGPCKLLWDQAARVHTLNSGRVSECLAEQKKALSWYEKAAVKGQTGQDFQYQLEDARARVQKLESMLRTIQRMEADQIREEVGGRS